MFRVLCKNSLKLSYLIEIRESEAIKIQSFFSNLQQNSEWMKAHSNLLKLGLDKTPIILLSYASSSSLTYARKLFDQIPLHSRDSFLWSAMISSYSRSNLHFSAIKILSDLLLLPSPPSPLSFPFSSAARSVAAIGNLFLARLLHSQVIRREIMPNVFVSTSIVDMYSKCGCLDYARKVFDVMPERNVVTWNIMLAGYVYGGMYVYALEGFYYVRCCFGGDEFAVSSGLNASAALCDLRSGEQIHGFCVCLGFQIDPVVLNGTAKMYFKCGEVGLAEKVLEGRTFGLVFDILMIKGYTFNEKYGEVVKIVSQSCGFVELFLADCSVGVSVLNSAANLGLIQMGKQVHGIILILGYYKRLCSIENDDTFMISALIDMYSRCFVIGEAWLVFNSLKDRDLSHWNALISGCIYNGSIQDARLLFDRMPKRNVISWTSMISGYVHYGFSQKALEMLAKLYEEEEEDEVFVRGNSFTFSAALDACSNLAALDAGKQIHSQVLRTLNVDMGSNLIVETALVDMYSRSGNLAYAQRVFDKMRNLNALSWTSMITGYATHGFASKAIEAFECMMREGFVPNEVTFVSVLNACSHCGLIEEGMQYFNLMKEKYGLAPRGDHYACVVDMLGRAGKLVEAQRVLESRKDFEAKSDGECGEGCDNDATIWGALLGGCKLHENVEIGSKVAKEMMKRKHQTSDTVVVLSNLYASLGNWDAVYNLREEWKKGFARMTAHSIV